MPRQEENINLPYSEQAEIGVLGAMLVDVDAARKAVSNISDEDFYVPSHRKIYKAMFDIAKKDAVIDDIVLEAEMGDEWTKDIAAKVEEIEFTISSARAVDEHIEIIGNLADRRKIIKICDDAIVAARKGEYKASELSAALALKASTTGRKKGELRWQKEIMLELIDDYERKLERGETPGCQFDFAVPTGISSLDEKLVFGGIARRSVTTIAAPTSKGKSALVANIVRGAAQAEQKVLCVTLEDDAKSVVTRELSQLSGVENRTLQRRSITADNQGTVFQAANTVGNFSVAFIDEAPLSGVDELIAQIRNAVACYKFDMLIIDFLQMINAGRGNGRSTQERIDYVFTQFATLAQHMEKTATVLVSQLRRLRVPNARPQKEHMYHSGILEQGSRNIILIWAHPEFDKKGVRILDIAKQHNGDVGPIPVGWRPQNVLFYDIDAQLSSEISELAETIETKMAEKAAEK
jgi:replicative DNA helicase